MDLSIPGSDFQSPSMTSNTPVFGDNVQDLLNVGALHVNPSSIITVNSIVDVVDDFDGVTTLREAINWANADELSDLIVFERSLFASEQSISLNLGQLDITHNLSIIAPRDELTGGNLLTVSGNNASRVFEIGSLATVSLDGLIIAGGLVTGDDGGGIKNSGILTLDSSIVSNNSALGRSGGGIFNNNGATLTVSNSTLGGNSAIFGGGIFNRGTLVLSNSTISDNSAGFEGGGIYNNSTLKVSNSTISGNSGSVYSGGINNSGGTVEISNSNIIGNSTSFYGGGINNSGGIMNVSNSTITGNSALGRRGVGGGIYNISGIVEVSNSTISSNSASLIGGGIYNRGTLTLSFSTLTLNSASNGGSALNEIDGTAKVRNTIIASNLPRTNGVNPDVAGDFTSLGYNLIGDRTGSTGFDEAIGDIVGTFGNPIDPRLAPLDFNGSPTQTIALLPDSPAIDAGDPTVLDTDPTTDQRGLPRVINGRADIGAFEFSFS